MADLDRPVRLAVSRLGIALREHHSPEAIETARSEIEAAKIARRPGRLSPEPGPRRHVGRDRLADCGRKRPRLRRDSATLAA